MESREASASSLSPSVFAMVVNFVFRVVEIKKWRDGEIDKT